MIVKKTHDITSESVNYTVLHQKIGKYVHIYKVELTILFITYWHIVINKDVLMDLTISIQKL